MITDKVSVIFVSIHKHEKHPAHLLRTEEIHHTIIIPAVTIARSSVVPYASRSARTKRHVSKCLLPSACEASGAKPEETVRGGWL